MFNINDYVVYKRNVCRVKDIKNISNIDYYSLIPIDDDSLTINVIVTDNNLRKIISREESEVLISKIPNIKTISVDDKNIENEYKSLFNSGTLEDLVKIIKTTYLRNQERILNHKKIGEKDDNYFKKAEKLLYNELSISLNMSYDELYTYIKSKVESKM